MSPIPVHLAVEDDLSEAVIRKLLFDTGRSYAIGTVFGRGGYGYLRSRVKTWNAAAAAGTPILLLTDLDQLPCPSGLIHDWLEAEPHANLIFRVAVREIESWLLADREGFADFRMRIAKPSRSRQAKLATCSSCMPTPTTGLPASAAVMTVPIPP